jgi:uncharacterized protein (DUF1330 family)
MTADIIVDVEVTDAEGYAEYAKRVPRTLEPFGGRFLGRGGRGDTLEGGGQRARIVVLAFPSLEKARDGGFRNLGAAAGRAPAHDLRPHGCGEEGWPKERRPVELPARQARC